MSEEQEERGLSVAELRNKFQIAELKESAAKPVIRNGNGTTRNASIVETLPKVEKMNSSLEMLDQKLVSSPISTAPELESTGGDNPFFRPISTFTTSSTAPIAPLIPPRSSISISSPIPPPIPPSRVISPEVPAIPFSKSNPPPRPITRSRPSSAISINPAIPYKPAVLSSTQGTGLGIQEISTTILFGPPIIPPRPPKQPVDVIAPILPILLNKPPIPERLNENASSLSRRPSYIAPRPIPVARPTSIAEDSSTAFLPLPPPRKLSPQEGLSRRSSYAHSPTLPTRPGSVGLQRSSSQHSTAQSSPSTLSPTSSVSSLPLPPPPSRATSSATVVPSRRASVLIKKSDDSFSEEDPELDDFPDASLANRTPPSSHLKSIKSQGNFYSFAMGLIGHDLGRGTSLAISLPGGEHKVHTIAWRGGKGKGEEDSRFAWGGTKDGHIFEVDTQEARIVSVRQNIHPSAVIKIFRLGQSMISIDEGGKLLLWNLVTSKVPADINQTPKAQRIPVSTFSDLLDGYLWTSTGPNSKSNASALASRSPQIRIYNPRADAAAFALTPKPVTTPLDAGQVGAVTAGAVSPLTKLIYLGHDDGQISIWDAFVCSRVQKVSSGNRITAMVGVGKHLWVGFKNGWIFIYEISQPMWTVTKAWKAHEDGVTSLIVDSSGLWLDGTLTIASAGADHTVHFWDGFLREDWLATELNKRKVDFCTFRTIRTLVVSWNIDSCTPSSLVGAQENVEFLNQVLTSVESPDIISFGFQEVIDLESKRLTAKTMLMGNKNDLSDGVSSSYRLWKEKLVQAVLLSQPPESPYSIVHVADMVGLFSCIFIKASETSVKGSEGSRSGLRDVASQSVKTGLMGNYGNKGGLLTRFVIDDSSLCFINVHIAAGQRNTAQRNRDLVNILETKSAFSTSLSSSPGAYNPGGNGLNVFDHEIVILSGDLNSRVDEISRNLVITAATNGDFAPLLHKDQLTKSLATNPTFRSFKEAPIKFAPTYKYDPGTNNYDSSAKNRIPAWCDRVLYRCQDGLVQPLSYRRYEVTTSDHRPISFSCEMKVKKIVPELRKEVWGQVELEWITFEKSLIEEAWNYYGQTDN